MEDKYIMGVDPAGDGNSVGAVMVNRVVDGEMTVEYTHRTRNDFEKEVRHLSKYFNAARIIEKKHINQSRLTRQFNSGEYQRSKRLQWANFTFNKYGTKG